MSTTAVWVHGNAVLVENPSDFSSVDRRGWGTDLTFSPGVAFRESVLHIPIPTPVLIRDVRTHLLRIFVLYETEVRVERQVMIKGIDIWDGGAQLDSVPVGTGPVPWQGSHLSAIDQFNRIDLSPSREVKFGIGLSLHCVTAGGPGPIRIAAAGADFWIQERSEQRENPIRIGSP
jgi:hypothetical protein